MLREQNPIRVVPRRQKEPLHRGRTDERLIRARLRTEARPRPSKRRARKVGHELDGAREDAADAACRALVVKGRGQFKRLFPTAPSSPGASQAPGTHLPAEAVFAPMRIPVWLRDRHRAHGSSQRAAPPVRRPPSRGPSGRVGGLPEAAEKPAHGRRLDDERHEAMRPPHVGQEAFFDATERPVRNTLGVALMRYRYDDAGRQVEESLDMSGQRELLHWPTEPALPQCRLKLPVLREVLGDVDAA